MFLVENRHERLFGNSYHTLSDPLMRRKLNRALFPLSLSVQFGVKMTVPEGRFSIRLTVLSAKNDFIKLRVRSIYS